MWRKVRHTLWCCHEKICAREVAVIRRHKWARYSWQTVTNDVYFLVLPLVLSGHHAEVRRPIYFGSKEGTKPGLTDY